MKNSYIQILYVEDEEVDFLRVVRFSAEKTLPYNIDRAANLAEAREMLKKASYDIVLIDYILPDGSGIDLLKEIKEIPSVIITGLGNELTAVNAIKSGAYDYIIKDNDNLYLDFLPYVIRKAINHMQMEKEKADAMEKQRVYIEELERMNKLLLTRETRIKELREENERLVKKIVGLGGK